MRKIVLLALCVGIFVSLWGTTHQYMGIVLAWPAFISAAVFFAAGHQLKDSFKVAIGHIIGLLWGISFLCLLKFSPFGVVDPQILLFLVLASLGFLAVIITHVGIDLFSHIPSLFSGWAITVAVLGGKNIALCGMDIIQIGLSMIMGIFFIGVGISQSHLFLTNLNVGKTEELVIPYKKIVKTDEKLPEPKNPQEQADNIKIEENISKIWKVISELKNNLQTKNERVGFSNIIDYGAEGEKKNEFFQRLRDIRVKILGVVGSPHKKGGTTNLMKECLNAAAEEGNVEVELIHLADYNIKPCRGCKSKSCYKECNIKDDDMPMLSKKLLEADGIIFGSPSYFGIMSGQLKIFLDRTRVLRHTNFLLSNKVVGALSVASRRHGGQETTNLDIYNVMMRHNALIVNDCGAVCQLGATGWTRTFDEGEEEKDEYGIETAKGLASRVVEVARFIKISKEILGWKEYRWNETLGTRKEEENIKRRW